MCGTWDKVNLPYTHAEFRILKFINKSIGFAVGTGVSLKTIDGGQTWKSFTISKDGTLIAFDKTGKGPALVLPKDIAPPKDAKIKLNNLVTKGEKGEAVKYFMTKVMGMPAIIVFLFKIFGKSLWRKNESVTNTLA